MPQLIFLALVVALAWWGYRSFLREANRVTARARRQEMEARNRTHGTLVKDPKTGEYRVARD